MEILKEETIEIKTEQLGHQKNTDGHLGPKCNNCGGFGFTLAIGGTSNSKGCDYCRQTGVAVMSNEELQNEVLDLKDKIEELTRIIIKFVKEERT